MDARVAMTSGILGTVMAGGGAAIGDAIGIAISVLGALVLVGTRFPPPPPPSGRGMAERAGYTLLVLGLLSGCGAVQAPAHVVSTVTVEAGEVDAATRWEVCAGRRACALVDVGLVSEDGRAVVCIELPQWGLLTCHEIDP
jgi:hypothetical protein